MELLTGPQHLLKTSIPTMGRESVALMCTAPNAAMVYHGQAHE